MLQRFSRVSRLGLTQSKDHVLACRSAMAMQSVAFQQQVVRAQPFIDQTSEIPQTETYHIVPAENPPVITPVFAYPEREALLDTGRFTIDCGGDVTEKTRAQMADTYAEHGIVYMTNTGLPDMKSMRDLVEVVIPSDVDMEYRGGSNWRNRIERNVYDTGAPACSHIHYHHEMAYVRRSPSSLGFMAASALPDGRGATFVSDQVAATKALLETDLGRKLKAKGVCYTRCLTDEEHYRTKAQNEFDVYNHWQKSMGTTDPDEAAEVARERGLQIEWDMEHPRYGRYLKTKFYVDAYEYCAAIDANVLFASVADHWMWFDTWPGVQRLPNDERPLKLTFGDDEEMSPEELRQFVDVYDQFGVPLRWQPGEVAVMCNYRWAHGRPMYEVHEGEQRELGVVLGSVFERQGQREDKW